jgi:hypothetical protein
LREFVIGVCGEEGTAEADVVLRVSVIFLAGLIFEGPQFFTALVGLALPEANEDFLQFDV